jgi:transposase
LHRREAQGRGAHDKRPYRQRHHIKNAFGRLQDCQRFAMRYDRCAHTFFSPIRIAATVIRLNNEP